MSRFQIASTTIPDLMVVRRARHDDSRGSLTRIFCADELHLAGWRWSVAQINHTTTVALGTVRGLHFQHPPYAEAKLVVCVRGVVWDVAVDLRRGSTSFMRWHAQELSADNCTSLLVPPGFAHGFQSLTEDVEMIYCHSQPHVPHAEDGLHPEDPRLKIPWPLPVTQLSARDRSHAFLPEAYAGIIVTV